MFADLTIAAVIANATTVVSAIGPVYMVPIGLAVATGLVYFAVRLAKSR